MVDLEVVQQAFGSSWNANMNFAKGLSLGVWPVVMGSVCSPGVGMNDMD